MYSLVALVVGVATLIGALWIRRGGAKVRSLLASGGIVDERFAVLFIPSFAFFLIFFGALAHVLFLPSPWRIICVTLCVIGAIIGIVGMIWGITSLPYPQSLKPSWLRDADSHLSKTLQSRSNASSRPNRSSSRSNRSRK